MPRIGERKWCVVRYGKDKDCKGDWIICGGTKEPCLKADAEENARRLNDQYGFAFDYIACPVEVLRLNSLEKVEGVMI